MSLRGYSDYCPRFQGAFLHTMTEGSVLTAEEEADFAAELLKWLYINAPDDDFRDRVEQLTRSFGKLWEWEMVVEIDAAEFLEGFDVDEENMH